MILDYEQYFLLAVVNVAISSKATNLPPVRSPFFSLHPSTPYLPDTSTSPP
jgi:hypothetical protein